MRTILEVIIALALFGSIVAINMVVVAVALTYLPLSLCAIVALILLAADGWLLYKVIQM